MKTQQVEGMMVWNVNSENYTSRDIALLIGRDQEKKVECRIWTRNDRGEWITRPVATEYDPQHDKQLMRRRVERISGELAAAETPEQKESRKPMNFGQFVADIGLDWADYLASKSALKDESPGAWMALAWVKAGKPTL